MVNGGEPRLRGCIGTLEARCLINGFKDYALNRYCCIMHASTFHALLYLKTSQISWLTQIFWTKYFTVFVNLR